MEERAEFKEEKHHNERYLSLLRSLPEFRQDEAFLSHQGCGAGVGATSPSPESLEESGVL